MPQGENLTPEHQANAGKGNRTHGAYSMQDNPLAKWPAGEQLQVIETAAELALQGAVEDHLRYRVAMGMVILGCIETYIAQELASGTPIEDLNILQAWPRFQNSTLRGLAQVKVLLDAKPEPKNVTEALDELGND